jgi:hypothetical protein
MKINENVSHLLKEAIANENYELAATLRDSANKINADSFIKELSASEVIANAIKRAYGHKYGATYKTIVKRLQSEVRKEAKNAFKLKFKLLKKNIGGYIYVERNWAKSGGYWHKLKDDIGFSSSPTQHHYCMRITEETLNQIAKYMYDNKDEISFF